MPIGQVLDHRRDVGEDPDAAAEPLLVVAELGLELGEIAHEHAGVMQERMTRRRRLEPGPMAPEQIDLDLLLEVGDPLADRGGRDVLALGRLGHGLLLHDRDEELERSQIEVHDPSRYTRSAVSWRTARCSPAESPARHSVVTRTTSS
jgi:hypothetical protein